MQSIFCISVGLCGLGRIRSGVVPSKAFAVVVWCY